MVINKENCDFSGWATRANMKCSDGRTIMKDAFIAQDGTQVPLVWNHQHDEASNVLGHALLENRDEGVYAYCKFNENESGKMGRELVRHGDVNQLSIYANRLKQQGGNVIHGAIREVSLVLAGANPGAFIDSIMCHGDDSDEAGIIYTGEDIVLAHSEDEVATEETLSHANEEYKETKTKEEEKIKMAESEKKEEVKNEEKTVKDVFDTLTEEQKTVVYALIGQALEDAKKNTEENENVKHSEGGNETMYNNVFDRESAEKATVLTHADQEAIIKLAKSSAVGSLQEAIKTYVSENTELSHADGDLYNGNWDVTKLFPDFQNTTNVPGMVERDDSWVANVMKKANKNPSSRIRTRHANMIAESLRAKGHKKGEQKANPESIKMILRTTDPQTVYVRDELHRDDILDITDFDIIAYQKQIMKKSLEETIAVAALIGDGREDTDNDKISETHIRSVWHDDDVFTIKATVDVAAAEAALQGTDTASNFGANYIFAEAFLESAMVAREQYRAKGQLDLYCTPHLLNQMLLARDLNGRRIYDSAADLAKALNVGAIHTVEQMEGRTREVGGKTHKLLGIFVNMGNYTFGSTKGGEITSFEQFDLDFNRQKYLMEARLSGALTEPFAAIAMEEVSAG